MLGKRRRERHDKVCLAAWRKLAERIGEIDVNSPTGYFENDDFVLTWGIKVTMKTGIPNKQDIFFINKNKKEGMIIDAAIVNHEQLGAAYQGKQETYSPLLLQIKRENKLKEINIVPIIMTIGGIPS